MLLNTANLDYIAKKIFFLWVQMDCQTVSGKVYHINVCLHCGNICQLIFQLFFFVLIFGFFWCLAHYGSVDFVRSCFLLPKYQFSTFLRLIYHSCLLFIVFFFLSFKEENDNQLRDNQLSLPLLVDSMMEKKWDKSFSPSV